MKIWPTNLYYIPEQRQCFPRCRHTVPLQRYAMDLSIDEFMTKHNQAMHSILWRDVWLNRLQEHIAHLERHAIMWQTTDRWMKGTRVASEDVAAHIYIEYSTECCVG